MPAAPRRIEPERLPRLRAAAQLLHRPTSMRDPVEVARACAGVQAQDHYPARLSFRSRSRRLTGDDVDRARSEERSLLRTWLMRMTIHMIPSEDAGWMLPVFEPRMEKWSRARLDQLGMPGRDVEKGLQVAARTLDREGPVTRTEMRDRIVAAGIDLNPQTRHHIIGLTVTSGLAYLGPDRGRTPCLVRREEWLGKLPRFEGEIALAELARRYLQAFGPASERDFAYWSGLPLGDVRRGLAAVGRELRELRVGEETLLSLRRSRRVPPEGQLRLLGAFDTYMLGYRDRGFAVPAEDEPLVSDGGGGIWPVIVEDGRVIGGWRITRKRGEMQIRLIPRTRFSSVTRRAVEAEVADIERFEGAAVDLVEDRAG